VIVEWYLKRTYHLQDKYLRVTLPSTGPILRPANRLQIQSEVAKLLLRPSLQMSLTTLLVTFARIPEHDPVMIRVTIKVAKFCASAWGMRKRIKNT
jgi:hypothetical protein